MDVKQFYRKAKNARPTRNPIARKWLTRITLAVLAAILTSNVSLASSNLSLVETQPVVSQSQIRNPQSTNLMQRGRELFQSEQFSAAAEVWKQAVSNFQAADDRLNQAQALSYLSLAYQQLGKWQDARDAIATSLSLLPKSGKGESGLILAQILNSKGNLELALGQAEDALNTWRKATEIYARIGDTDGAIGGQINQAQAMQNLGMYRNAKKLLEEIEGAIQKQPNSLIKATGLRSLGNTLRAIGDLDGSLKLLMNSLQIAQELGAKQAIAAAQFSLGNTGRILAKRSIDFQDPPKAKKETEAALQAYQEAAKISASPIIRVQAQLNQLSLLIDNQQWQAAEALLPQIQLDELPTSRRSVYARINLAQSLLKIRSAATTDAGAKVENNYSQSQIAKILATAINEAKSLNDLRAESYAIGNLGAIYELTKQTENSLELTKEALVLAQSISASDIAYRWQWQLGRLLKAQGENKNAIAAYTQAVETLKSLRGDLVAVNPDNPDIQFSFRDSVEPVYRQLVDLLVSTGGEQDQENLRQAREIIESLQLAELDNFFQEACLNAKPVKIDKIDRSAAVIYPIILPDKIAVILSLPDESFRLYTTNKTYLETEQILDELQQDIGRVAANRQRVLSLSQQVYDWLIRPGEVDLQKNNVQTLVFVLDGLLRNIPMSALHDGKQYLIEKYSVALTPGLHLLPPQPLKREQFRVLTAGLSEARSGFTPLPNVGQELQQIRSQVNNSETLLNQDFTDTKFRQALNLFPFPVVHIATHGQFSSQADKTFILTWNGKIKVKDLDWLLRQKQTESSHPIELLVFSACETAEGDNRAALGLAGVAVRAGARSTLATLWRVNDESTAAFMVKFYSELANSEVSKSEALRRAQISILKQNRYRTPYFWAPFVLVGNWR